MALWMWLVLLASAVFAAKESQKTKTQQTLANIEGLINYCLKAVDEFGPMYPTDYARANLEVRMKSAKIKIDEYTKEIKSDLTQSRKMELAKLLVPEIGSSVMCLSAQLFLLPTNYMSAKLDWSGALDCVASYTGPIDLAERKSKYLNLIEYEQYKEADQLLQGIFIEGRENYLGNECHEMKANGPSSKHFTTDAVVAHKIVNILVPLWKANSEQRAEHINSEQASEDHDYANDVRLYNERVGKLVNRNTIVGQNTIINWRYVTEALTVFQQVENSDKCRLAWQHVMNNAHQIDAIQRELGVYKPYKLPANIDGIDEYRLIAYQNAYKWRFGAQIEMLCHGSRKMFNSHFRYDEKMKALDETFSQKISKNTLDAYLQEMNRFGHQIVTELMPLAPRFMHKPSKLSLDCVEPKHMKQIQIIEYLRQSIYPDVSLLPHQEYRVQIEDGKLHSQQQIIKFAEKQIANHFKQHSVSKYTDCDVYMTSLENTIEAAREKIEGKHSVYYAADISEEVGYEYYEHLYSVAREKLEKKQHVEEWILYSLVDGIAIPRYLSSVITQIDDTMIKIRGHNKFGLEMFRRLMTIIQYLDVHTEPICMGINPKDSESKFIERIIFHATKAISKYEKELHKQIEAATYLDEYEYERIKGDLERSYEEMFVNEEKFKIEVEQSFGRHREQSHEGRVKGSCQKVYEEIHRKYQRKLAESISPMVHAPIMLNGIAPVPEFTAIFHGVCKTERKWTDKVWETIRINIGEVQHKLEYLPDERSRFKKYVDELRVRHATFDPPIERNVAAFYAEFVNMLRPMLDQKTYEERTEEQFTNIYAYLYDLKSNDILNIVRKYVDPLEIRLRQHFEHIKQDCKETESKRRALWNKIRPASKSKTEPNPIGLTMIASMHSDTAEALNALKADYFPKLFGMIAAEKLKTSNVVRAAIKP